MDAPGNNLSEPREKVIKREMISSDKDGTLEKLWLEPGIREDGTLSEPWEIHATGKKVNELRGAFKDTAPQMMHEQAKEWEDHGGNLLISRPDGTNDTIRADKEALYREQPGFCVRATKPTFSVNGFGGMRLEGLRRIKYLYHNGMRTIVEREER